MFTCAKRLCEGNFCECRHSAAAIAVAGASVEDIGFTGYWLSGNACRPNMLFKSTQVPATEEPPRPALESEPSQKEESSSAQLPSAIPTATAAEPVTPGSITDAAPEQTAAPAPVEGA